MCDCSGTDYGGELCKISLFVLLRTIEHHFFLIVSVIICDPECQNGGTCSAPNTCVCSPGYIGDGCQTGELQHL